MSSAPAALSRFTVLDLTRVRSGPTCVRQLSDWGANVIKIEMPDRGEGGEGLGGPRRGSGFLELHPHKRRMAPDPKTQGRRGFFEKPGPQTDTPSDSRPSP